MFTQIKVGDRVQTCDKHEGIVTKVYHVTGVLTDYIHIRECTGRIYYCPVSDVVLVNGAVAGNINGYIRGYRKEVDG